MKNKQYSLKVFETTIKSEESFIEFFDKNYLLFKDHLISIKGELTNGIEEYLKNKSLMYVVNTELPLGRTRKALEEEFKLISLKDEENKVENSNLEIQLERCKSQIIEGNILQQESRAKIESLTKKLDTSFTVLDSMVRSGRELNIDGDLLLLNRVNSGATIYTSGNMIITKVVEGALRCDGKFMMITVSPKANIIFNGVVVDNDLLTDKLNRIELKNREIFITPVIQKEINWA